ncbi:hypothetical protein [Streptomyces fructofermentans]|nr:hypothetical protein [Streptomyces fructofermentans]
MTDINNSESLPELPFGEEAEQLSRVERLQQPGGSHGSQRQNEMTGLVLLINTVLGGLGTLYATTKSARITLAAALLVFLIVVVVLIVRRVVVPGDEPQGEDGRGGK